MASKGLKILEYIPGQSQQSWTPSTAISAEAWNERKRCLGYLYLERNLTLETIQEMMQNTKFNPSISQYKTQFAEWRFWKYELKRRQAPSAKPAYIPFTECMLCVLKGGKFDSGKDSELQHSLESSSNGFRLFKNGWARPLNSTIPSSDSSLVDSDSTIFNSDSSFEDGVFISLCRDHKNDDSLRNKHPTAILRPRIFRFVIDFHDQTTSLDGRNVSLQTIDNRSFFGEPSQKRILIHINMEFLRRLDQIVCQGGDMGMGEFRGTTAQAVVQYTKSLLMLKGWRLAREFMAYALNKVIELWEYGAGLSLDHTITSTVQDKGDRPAYLDEISVGLMKLSELARVFDDLTMRKVLTAQLHRTEGYGLHPVCVLIEETRLASTQQSVQHACEDIINQAWLLANPLHSLNLLAVSTGFRVLRKKKSNRAAIGFFEHFVHALHQMQNRSDHERLWLVLQNLLELAVSFFRKRCTVAIARYGAFDDLQMLQPASLLMQPLRLQLTAIFQYLWEQWSALDEPLEPEYEEYLGALSHFGICETDIWLSLSAMLVARSNNGAAKESLELSQVWLNSARYLQATDNSNLMFCLGLYHAVSGTFYDNGDFSAFDTCIADLTSCLKDADRRNNGQEDLTLPHRPNSSYSDFRKQMRGFVGVSGSILNGKPSDAFRRSWSSFSSASLCGQRVGSLMSFGSHPKSIREADDGDENVDVVMEDCKHSVLEVEQLI